MDSVSTAHLARPSVTAYDAHPTHVRECILRSKFSAKAVSRMLFKINEEYRFGDLCAVAAHTNFTGKPSRFEIARFASARTAEGHFPQGSDPVFKRWVCAEQRRPNGAAPEHWFHDAKSRSRLRNVAGNALIVRSKFLQCADQAKWLAGHSCTGLVGRVFALP